MNWDKIFQNNHLDSWPTASLTVSKVKPNGQGARSIYGDDKKMILDAAKKYGYRVLIENDKLVSFIRK